MLQVKEILQQNLKRLEEDRLLHLKEVKKNLVIYILFFGSIVLCFLIDFIKTSSIFSFYAVPFFSLLIYCGYNKDTKKYNDKFKENIIPILLKHLVCNDSGKLHKDATYPDLKDFGLYFNENTTGMSGGFSCNIEGIDLDFYDISSHDSQKVGKFNGAVCLLTLPFEFNSHTKIVRDKGRVLNYIKKSSKLSQVRLDNTEFEKKFEVYTNNNQNAFYLITPKVMEHLLKIQKIIEYKSFKGNKFSNFMYNSSNPGISLEFKGNKLLILLKFGNEIIEPASVFKSALELKNLDKTFAELDMIVSLVKQLKLDYLKDRKTAVDKINSINSN